MKSLQRIWRYLTGTMLAAVMVLSMLTVAGAAEADYAYPTSTNKKGLYVCPGMEEDAIELNVQHATINLSVGEFMPPKAYRNESHCVPFEFEGETYWFSKEALGRYDTELNRLAQNNVIVTAILLLPKRTDDLQYLIYPAARDKNANYYQWNMTDARAVKALRAIVTFFQRRYLNPAGARIVGWIVGNEVNNSGVWNWAGNIDIDTYVGLYASQVAEVFRAARSVYGNARIYMCLDHYWTASNGTYWYPGRTILEKFAVQMEARGLARGSWCIAYHPYNISQYEPNIMSSSSAVTNNINTRIFTMKNIHIFTKYVKATLSMGCRIILSEQGYSSITSGRDTSKEQAKNIALAYYIAQQNKMIDSLILHRQVDHTGEGERYGLYSSWGGENAAYQKISWNTYKYVDTTKTNSYIKYAEKQAKKISKKTVQKQIKVSSGKMKRIKGLAWAQNFTNGFAPYGAVSTFDYSNNSYVLGHDSTRNGNVPWGMTRVGRINCKNKKKFGFGIAVNGSQSGRSYVYLRLWSGPKRYYDATVTVTNGAPNKLYVNLKDWKYRGTITRVDIYIRPVGGVWADGASAMVVNVGIKK